MTHQITRDDIRYSTIDQDSTYRAFINASPMGYWLGDGIDDFKQAIVDELRYVGLSDEEVQEGVEALVIEECLETDEYGDPVWTRVFGY